MHARAAVSEASATHHNDCGTLKTQTSSPQPFLRRVRLEADPSSVRRSLVSTGTYSLGTMLRSRTRFCFPAPRMSDMNPFTSERATCDSSGTVDETKLTTAEALRDLAHRNRRAVVELGAVPARIAHRLGCPVLLHTVSCRIQRAQCGTSCDFIGGWIRSTGSRPQNTVRKYLDSSQVACQTNLNHTQTILQRKSKRSEACGRHVSRRNPNGLSPQTKFSCTTACWMCLPIHVCSSTSV